MPASNQAGAVDRLVRAVARAPVPENELDRGYRCAKDRIGILGLTSVPSETVHSPRVLVCRIQLAAVLDGVHAHGRDSPPLGDVAVFEVRATPLYLDASILMGGHRDRTEPSR